MPSWREAAIDSRVGLPHFDGFSWRVDVVNGTSSLASANEPALHLNFSVRGQPTEAGALPASKQESVDLSAATLGALLEGMRRIKDQLAGIQAAQQK